MVIRSEPSPPFACWAQGGQIPDPPEFNLCHRAEGPGSVGADLPPYGWTCSLRTRLLPQQETVKLWSRGHWRQLVGAGRREEGHMQREMEPAWGQGWSSRPAQGPGLVWQKGAGLSPTTGTVCVTLPPRCQEGIVLVLLVRTRREGQSGKGNRCSLQGDVRHGTLGGTTTPQEEKNSPGHKSDQATSQEEACSRGRSTSAVTLASTVQAEEPQRAEDGVAEADQGRRM